MRGDETWHSSWGGIAIALVLLTFLALVAVSGAAPEQSGAETRYLHQHPGASGAYLGPADAAMQAKGIAASRHRSPGEVRRLMDDCTEGRGAEALGHQRIHIEYFNRRLDERWPAE